MLCPAVEIHCQLGSSICLEFRHVERNSLFPKIRSGTKRAMVVLTRYCQIYLAGVRMPVVADKDVHLFRKQLSLFCIKNGRRHNRSCGGSKMWNAIKFHGIVDEPCIGHAFVFCGNGLQGDCVCACA